MNHSTSLPWDVPVPVRDAPSFRPLREGHGCFGVVTDLGAIESFGIPPATMAADHIAAADLQTNIDVNAVGRLGSGRALFYRGKYLKGTGRTPLAANWADPDDVYHNSGHLFASAAAREYAVSVLAGRLGFRHAIVPCEGVLVRELDPRLQGILARSLPERYHRIQHPAADEALQAITVKPGGFARLSNLCWLWNTQTHAAEDSFVVTASRLSYSAFTGTRGGAADAALSPPVVVAALGAAIRQAIVNCLAFIEGGVFWGSFHNNFTADGRFLDLELPTLTGGDFLGVGTGRDDTSTTAQWPAKGVNVGTEVFRYLTQVRQFIRFWEHRLRWLAESGKYLGSLARRFCLGLADCLRETFTADSLAFSRELVLEHLLGLYRRRLSLGSTQVESLEQLLREAYAGFFEGGCGRLWDFERLEINPPDTEPGVQVRLYYPSFLVEAMERPARRCQTEFWDLLRRADSEARPEPWLESLRNYHSSPNQHRDCTSGVRTS